MSETTCAIIVTFNRCDALRRCLLGVFGQTLVPTSVLVVNNASSDGTLAMVSSLFPSVSVLSLNSNVGGAGGFRAGLEDAHRKGFSRYWLMDDDGFPERDCLAALTEVLEEKGLGVVAPVVLADPYLGTLAFGINASGKRLLTHGELVVSHGSRGLVHTDAAFFNGILLRRVVLETIGLPNPALFIRGDEVEYFFRARRAGVRCATYIAARFVHPSGLEGKFPLLGRRLVVCFTGSQLKDYCTYRNRAYIFWVYRKYHLLLLDIIRYLVFFALIRSSWEEVDFWVRASLDGVRGTFGRERHYLADTGNSAGIADVI